MTFDRHIIFILTALLGCMAGWAQDGSSAYGFLNVPASAHVYALGGTNITVIDDDVNLIDQNPGLLGPEFGTQAGLNYMRYLGGSNFMGARLAAPAGEHGAWAIGVQYFGYGSIDGYGEQGNSTGQFSPSDIAFSATYSHDISDRWRGGITLKVVQSNYEIYKATAICADLGVNYYNPDNNLSLSVVAKHLGGQVKRFTDQYDRLPWDIQIGIAKTLGDTPLRLSVTAYNLNKWSLPYYSAGDSYSTGTGLEEHDSFISNLFRHLIFGLEYAPSDKFYIALGYNYKVRTDMSTYSRNFLSGFSAGAGLKVKSMGFGIALAQPHVGGTTFMFNLTASVSEMLNR